MLGVDEVQQKRIGCSLNSFGTCAYMVRLTAGLVESHSEILEGWCCGNFGAIEFYCNALSIDIYTPIAVYNGRVIPVVKDCEHGFRHRYKEPMIVAKAFKDLSRKSQVFFRVGWKRCVVCVHQHCDSEVQKATQTWVLVS